MSNGLRYKHCHRDLAVGFTVVGRIARRHRGAVWLTLVVGAVFPTSLGAAETAASCGGFAMLGGAQLSCSHVVPKAPTQFCTFSWALMTTSGAIDTVAGSFLLPPGASNMTVYQGTGFNSALSNPIVLCQGKRS